MALAKQDRHFSEKKILRSPSSILKQALDLKDEHKGDRERERGIARGSLQIKEAEEQLESSRDGWRAQELDQGMDSSNFMFELLLPDSIKIPERTFKAHLSLSRLLPLHHPPSKSFLHTFLWRHILLPCLACKLQAPAFRF